MSRKLIHLALLALVLASCAPPGPPVAYGVSRIVDEEAGVACWLRAGGISCLPLKDTDLDTGRAR